MKLPWCTARNLNRTGSSMKRTQEICSGRERVKGYAMRGGQNEIIWTFFMPITSIISLRAQVLLPENDKRKEKYKKVPSLLVILILSYSIFHFINLGVPLKQISEKKKKCNIDDEINLIK